MKGLVVNGQEWPPGPRHRRPIEQPAQSIRIFDHLDGTDPDEDRHLSRVAHSMIGGPRDDRKRRSAWWLSVPTYDEPAPVAGEMRAKTERGKRALYGLRQLMTVHGWSAEDVACELAEALAAKH